MGRTVGQLTMRTLKEDRSPFRIEISPGSWAQLGLVSGEAFQEIQRGLKAVAEREEALWRADAVREPHAVVIQRWGTMEAVVEISRPRQTVRLRELRLVRGEGE
jgi:hypothetical protein